MENKIIQSLQQHINTELMELRKLLKDQKDLYDSKYDKKREGQRFENLKNKFEREEE